MGTLAKSKKLGLFAITMITASFVISVRNLPALAETGMQMLFFGIVAAIFYMIPAALVSAELATGWNEQGGIYIWVRAAFGERLGFLAAWLQWTYMLMSIMAMLYFVAGSLAFVTSGGALSSSRLYLIITSLCVLWLFTYLNLKGIKTSSKISAIGFLGGVLFPGLLIIVLGLWRVISIGSVEFDYSFSLSNLFPDFSNVRNIVLLAGFMRALAGIEASSTHANLVDNPKRNYPIAIFSVFVISLVINLLGALTVASVIPRESISLESGVMFAFKTFFSELGIGWLVIPIGVLVAMGQAGGLSTWLSGPVKSLLSAAQHGDLPSSLRKVNKAGAPRNLMLFQASLVSILLTCLLAFATINVAFWFSVAVSVMIYLTMYFMMFLSAIRLRYTAAEVDRHYRVPGRKNIGMWIVALLGIFSSVAMFFISSFPPAQLEQHTSRYYTLLIWISIAVVYVLPFVIIKICRNKNICNSGEE